VSLVEKLRVGTFVGLVAVVYILAGKIALERVIQWFRPGSSRTKPLPPRRRRWRVAVVWLSGLGLLCFGYGWWVEPSWLEVTRVRITSPKLPPGSRPLRIVHLTDIHSDARARLEERLPDLVAQERPDLIVFTGDAANSPAGIPVFKRCLRRLAEVAPTYVVKGNWEIHAWPSLDRFGGTGARELDGEGLRFSVAGVDLWISGAAWGRHQLIGAALDPAPREALKLFLYHSPDQVLEAARLKADLYLCGHTHGGQVALPFYGALVTFSKFDKRFEAGLYRVDSTWLYVNRGIGMDGGAPRVRFCARPELAVIELAPEPSAERPGGRGEESRETARP
jgi:predicted MPP superfamily phosphohydrolase